MFSFHKLDVYVKSKAQNHLTLSICRDIRDPDIRSQLKRASLSVTLNIAEGAGRKSYRDKKRFYTISRGSVFECVAILELLFEMEILSEDDFILLYEGYEEVSKMLYGLINSEKLKD